MFSMPYNTPTLVVTLFGWELEYTPYGFAKGWRLFRTSDVDKGL